VTWFTTSIKKIAQSHFDLVRSTCDEQRRGNKEGRAQTIIRRKATIEWVEEEKEIEVFMLEVTETWNNGGWNDRPPDPREPDKSNDNESQEPITEEEMIVTTGREGWEGADTVTLIDTLLCQSTQGITFVNTWHFARRVDPFNRNTSPTCNNDTTATDDAVVVPGNNEKLWSSTHTQRDDEVRKEVDSSKEPHPKTFENPPRFVGESNSTNTLTPSRENVAEINKGGEGSASGLNTLNTLPRGYSKTHRTVEERTFTSISYDPGLWWR
jgi:hypothetical protein